VTVERFNAHDIDTAKWIALQFETRSRALALRVVARRLAEERAWSADRMREWAAAERGKPGGDAVLADEVLDLAQDVQMRRVPERERGRGS
jgi:hypothetical protein